MGITLFGRGVPLSAVDDGTTLQVAYGGTAIMDITTSGLSGTIGYAYGTTITATNLKATNVSATLVSATTICGATVASAVNVACTFAAGGSAGLSAGNFGLCADRWLALTINNKGPYYIPAYASAGTFSAA